jgi:OmcA/MtrC family decaheme c-type cytochrome
MKCSYAVWGAAALVLATLAGCGGSSGSDSTPPTAALSPAIAAAAAVPANDSAVNPFAPFTVLQGAGVPAVAVKGPPKVNFTVFSDGTVKTGLAITNVSVIIAKLVPGTNGNPDQWQSYTHRLRAAATAASGVTYTPAVQATLDSPAYPSQIQAYTDPKQTDAALLAAQLVYNADGYYTYTFSTDITDPAQTNGVVFQPGNTHRVVVQLSYANAAGDVVRVNPRFDFTVDANGNSVALADPATQDHLMADVGQCNTCHEKLAAHGGGRVDVQYCVTCHNPGTIDPNSGNVLTLSTMVHSIHSGQLLASQAATAGGEYYTVRTSDFSNVGFPQDLRNCATCHTSANPATPQGDNWKSVPSQQACLTCHANNAGSPWNTSHVNFATALYGPSAVAKDLTNADCAGCHRQGSNLGSDTVHWAQGEVNKALYKMNIESVVFNDTADHKGRTVTAKYFLSNPMAGDAPYNLVTSDCTGTPPAPICANTTMFGNLRFYLGYQNMIGQSTVTTEFSAYNNGGSSANVFAYTGTNDGNNHYTVAIPLPDDTATAVAFGTGIVASAGQIKEVLLQAMSAANPRPPVVPTQLVNTVAQHTSANFVISGTLQPRRTIVSNEKCNVCHVALGSASGSNTLPNAFHSGARDTVESCVICHDPNRVSTTVMTGGQQLNEAYQFKRMIHGLHGNSRRTSPFTNGNKVVGSFCNPANLTASQAAGCDPTLTLAASVTNFAAEVQWPGVGLNCNACHVNNSYQTDLGTLGAVVLKYGDTAAGPALFGGATALTDPWTWNVISPKAATCTACHDSPSAQAHVASYGNGTFGTLPQNQWPQETCADCHAVGLFMGVDRVHGLN